LLRKKAFFVPPLKESNNIEYGNVEQRVIPVILRTMLQEAGPPPLMRRALRGRKAGHDCFLTNHLKLGFRDHCRRGTGTAGRSIGSAGH